MQLSSGLTAGFCFTKLVEPIPNNALSMSEALLDKTLLLYSEDLNN